MHTRKIRVFASVLSFVVISTLGTSTGLARQAKSNPDAAKVVTLLEKSGYTYKKVDDGIWEIQFKGENLKEFPLRVALAPDIVLFMVKLADRKDLKPSDALLVKLLELNDKMDSIKFALSDDMLYARVESHTRVLDLQEFKYLLQQTSGAVDEAYPQIKQYLSSGKQ